MELNVDLIDLIGSGEALPNDYARFARCFADDFYAYWQAVKRGEVNAPAVEDDVLQFYHSTTEQLFYIAPTEDDPDALTYIVTTTIRGRELQFELSVGDGLADELDDYIYDGKL